MRLSVTDFIDEFVQEIDHCTIVALGLDRTEHDWRTALKGAPSWSKGTEVYVAYHDATVVNQ